MFVYYLRRKTLKPKQLALRLVEIVIVLLGISFITFCLVMLSREILSVR